MAMMRRTQEGPITQRVIDPAEWLVILDAEGFRCGACRQVLIANHRLSGLPSSLRLMREALDTHLPTCPRAQLITQPHPDVLCVGESLCDGCGWCSDCERIVGEPHIPICACPPDTKHRLCNSCHAKFVAWNLTAGVIPKEPWWRD